MTPHNRAAKLFDDALTQAMGGPSESVVADAINDAEADVRSSITHLKEHPSFRGIITFLRHSNMKLSAVWLVRKLNPDMSIPDALKWVEETSCRLPISLSHDMKKIRDTIN